MSIHERLDRYHGLIRQNPWPIYRVAFIRSGSIITSAFIDNTQPIFFEVNGQEIPASGFLADNTTYYLETHNVKEAYYLTSILNSHIVDELIKPMQSRGLWGPRDIHKKVLELPIP